MFIYTVVIIYQIAVEYNDWSDKFDEIEFGQIW